jgi:MOSC domain-containing protein YiiM
VSGGEIMPPGVLRYINVSAGGVPKTHVESADIGPGGVQGDRQRNRRIHGGPRRAVCLYSLDLIEALRLEGHPIAPGHAGENLTIGGVDWSRLAPGVIVGVGGAELEITSYTVPCTSIRASFADGRFMRMSQRNHPGWSRVYACVRRPGHVRVGDRVIIRAGRPRADAPSSWSSEHQTSDLRLEL